MPFPRLSLRGGTMGVFFPLRAFHPCDYFTKLFPPTGPELHGNKTCVWLTPWCVSGA